MSPRHSTLVRLLVHAHLKRRRMQNILALLGIAVGTMVLIVALSLTNGFGGQLVEATLRATPHLVFSGPAAPENQAFAQRLREHPAVKAISPFLADKALITRPARADQDAGVDFATLFGVPPEAAQVLQLHPDEAAQLRELGPDEIMLGMALASNLGAFVGDEVRLLNSQQKRRSLKVVGVFSTGNYIVDSAYAFTSLKTLQDIQGTSKITGYQVRLQDYQEARAVALELGAASTYSAAPWQDLYGSLLDQLKLQKFIISFIVFMIVLVASLGIANVLTLSVFEKTQEIAILRAIGATRRLMLQIFVLEGIILGVSGLLLGNLLGLAISGYFIWRPFTLPGELYFISKVPVIIRASDIVWVNAVALVTTLLAALLPARRAASIEPGRIIR